MVLAASKMPANEIDKEIGNATSGQQEDAKVYISARDTIVIT
jgi:hypothetical protein